MSGDVPYEVLDDPLPWVKAFVNRLDPPTKIVFDDLVKDAPLHLKHVESLACAEVQKLAKEVGVCCADVLHILELQENQREQYIQQLEYYLTACAAGPRKRSVFGRLGLSALRVTSRSFEEKSAQVFVLSEYIEMTQLVTLLVCSERDALAASLGEDFLKSKTFASASPFRCSWLLLPLNENNTSNYCVDRNGFVVRVDYADCDFEKELRARLQLNGLNTHGKSIVAELVEVFKLGVEELGAEGVFQLVQRTHANIVRARSADGSWHDRPDKWLKFFTSTPLGHIFVNQGSGQDLIQMINAYLQKDLALIPLPLPRSQFSVVV